MDSDTHSRIQIMNLWQAYRTISSHLKVLSKVVLEENNSAAIQFAIQSEGIIKECESMADRQIV